MYDVILHLEVFSIILDEPLNYWTMSSSAIMPSTELAMSVLLSAYHLLVSVRPRDEIS